MRIGILGCGRMGSMIARMACAEKDLELVACVDSDSPGEEELCGVKVSRASELERVLAEKKPDVVIDFSGAEATAANAPVVLRHSDAVIGTTGLSAAQTDEIGRLVRESGRGAVISPNMALGVNVLFSVVEQVARALPLYDVEIVEAHHRTKKDAPSGTAKRLAEKIGRDAPVHAIRAGGIVGDHTVIFASQTERLELTHRAHSREAFAAGALAAARFVKGRKGVFSMKEVLGL